MAKCSKKMYTSNPFDAMTAIKYHSELRPKSKLVNGEWIKDFSQTEEWISNYIVCNEIR